MCYGIWLLPAALMAVPSGLHNLAIAGEQAHKPEDDNNHIPAFYSNEEEVYFDGEAGREVAPKITISVTDGKIVYLDDFGSVTAPPKAVTVQKIEDATATLIIDGRPTVLRRANTALCWAAVRKEKPSGDAKAESGEDWHFVRALKTHDQGGRVRIGGADTGAPEAIIRLRSVVWPPPSTARPSKVIYIHTADDPDRAVSYSWANMAASRVGINLRWVQASCTIEGADPPAKIDR